MILCSLIHVGKMPSYPDDMSRILKMKFEVMFSTYRSLAEAFTSKNDQNFNEAISQGWIEFEKDKNTGLINKLMKIYQQRPICDLNFTYLTLRYK